MTAAGLEVRDLVVEFGDTGVWRRKHKLRAVDGVSFAVAPGETFGLVGESGCGKSTLGRAIVGLIKPQEGEVLLDGEIARKRKQFGVGPTASPIQMVFQDPVGSLDPRMKVREIVGEGLELQRDVSAHERELRIMRTLEEIGLPLDAADRYPREFSGGQRQRIAIARAIIVRPRVIVADEPVSALDVSIQSQVINLLRDLRSELNLSYVFIAHNLAVVSYISDRVGVMYLGSIVELAATSDVIQRPLHPYTVALISAIPEPDPDAERKRIMLSGDLPNPMFPPSGCRFRTRCPIAQSMCGEQRPPLVQVEPGHHVACHFPGALAPQP
jgi:oligopeptide/dipeptide ABC transporter ATP-binding protein